MCNLYMNITSLSVENIFHQKYYPEKIKAVHFCLSFLTMESNIIFTFSNFFFTAPIFFINLNRLIKRNLHIKLYH